jgi:hypothetical protein
VYYLVGIRPSLENLEISTSLAVHGLEGESSRAFSAQKGAETP